MSARIAARLHSYTVTCELSIACPRVGTAIAISINVKAGILKQIIDDNGHIIRARDRSVIGREPKDIVSCDRKFRRGSRGVSAAKRDRARAAEDGPSQG